MQELISRIKKGNPRMKYDFDTVVNRRNTDSLKWNVAENELPMWVADMDFKIPQCVQKSVFVSGNGKDCDSLYVEQA